MVDPLTLLAFVPAALALNLTPGADMLFCLGQGLRSGPKSAVAASAGISAGAFVHTGAAGLGLGALIAALPWAFDAIRWLGVAYLLWLALQALRGGAHSENLVSIQPAQAFRDGLMVNLTNPKVILFVLAFVPQFVSPEKGDVLAQFLIFGAVLSLGGFLINAVVGVFAGGVGRQLTGSPVFARWLGRVSAGIFTALALRLALLQKG
ncbi:LysE family translocator [Thalassovita gelatinovora]|uniref:LysE family translocator n=1 Tax=Thalassovita gelatinovora TaxID=53501 RepID=UPI00071D05C2|nr:LysE family translocator [Thalassovita gelatinovora]QIZ82616.1 LysE family translocator [Thalassovita gelatinovora]